MIGEVVETSASFEARYRATTLPGGQREPAPAKRVPDTEPERRAQCARAGTSSSKEGEAVAVHGASAPHLQPRNAAHGLLLVEEGSCVGRGRGDVAALRRGVGEESPGPFRKAEARSVPSEAGA